MTLAVRSQLRPAFVPVARRESWLVSARKLACRCVERWAGAVLALGVAGMLGFVGSLIAFSQRRLDTPAFLGATALSLVVYAVSLLVGHLGDPAALERRGAAS